VTHPPHRAPDDGVRTRQQQIAADLRALILSGDLPPGEKVPSTDALVQTYAVTNQTVQRALAILKGEGFLEGRKGSGVFVTGRQPITVRANHYSAAAPAGRPYPWISDHASRGRQAAIELLSVGEQKAPAQVAAAFGIDTETLVVVRHQLLLLDGEPAELVWSYYPVEIARGTRLAERRKIPGGSPKILAELGYPLADAVDQIGTRLATVDEFIALKLPQDMPVLRQLRVVFSKDHQPVEVTVMVKGGQQYEVQYQLPQLN
jgi:GntR family transcriptional regulator